MEKKRKTFLTWVGRLGAGYFAVCLLAWAAVLALGSWPTWRKEYMPEVDGVDWPMFLHALPALALTAGFATAGAAPVHRWPRRREASRSFHEHQAKGSTRMPVAGEVLAKGWLERRAT